MEIIKDIKTACFDIAIKTRRGKLFCVNIQREEEMEGAEIEMSKHKGHKELGHEGEESTIIVAKAI